ncbi:hypothetical protein PMIN06_011834 [Paraphaeosphaeria minitans]
MAGTLSPPATANRKRLPTAAKKPQRHRGGVHKATTIRRNSRIASVGAGPIQTPPDSVQRSKRPRQEDEDRTSSSLEPPVKRTRASAASVDGKLGCQTIGEARVDYWRENGNWPTEEQEKTMDRFRDIIHHALARKRSSASLRRKRSDASINAETVLSRTPSDQQPREQKSAPYRHPRYEGQLRERGSFMCKYAEGITAESKELCQKLLRTSQQPPEHTLFDEDIFEDTLDMIKGRNETRVIRDIAQLIVPSGEILALRGTEHLKILRETTNAGWNNTIPFCGPRPQPDYGLGFKREAFNRQQLQKLQPFVGNELEDCSYVAATYDMYLPFLTCEVKCGASALDIADRQNAHNQTVALQNLVELFRLVGREKELHREINGFSISHNDMDVRIWGHYVAINGRDTMFYRHPIREFSIKNTELDRGKRWTAYNFVRNVYDLWVPNHFKRICSAINMLPASLNFEVSDHSKTQSPDQELSSSCSGPSQRLEDDCLADEGLMSDSQPSTQLVTTNRTIQSKSSKSKRRKK